MTAGAGLPDRLSYLQRAAEHLAGLSDRPVKMPRAPYRAEFEVTGVAREFKVGDDKGSEAVGSDPHTWMPSTAKMLVAMHTSGIPLCFSLCQSGGRIRLRLGTWADNDNTLLQMLRVLGEALMAVDIQVDLSGPIQPQSIQAAGPSGYLLGLPSVLVPTAQDPGTLLDRLIRSAIDSTWRFNVIAVPIAESHTVQAREQALDEIREIQEQLEARRVTAPLAEHHRKLSEALVEHLTLGSRIGAWRTAAYVTAGAEDPGAYTLVSGVLRGLANGEKSVPEPVRVVDDPAAARLGAAWGFADVAGRPGPGRIRRFYEYQSMLNSNQLSAYIHLPEVETPGFSVRRHARFDSEPTGQPKDASISLGIVATNDLRHQVKFPLNPENRPPGKETRYGIATNDLSRHVFIPGVTGAGKTNTVLHLLTQVAKQGIPFLVLEPAKTEYRTLIQPQLIPGTTVYTVGREKFAPLRLNPFEVLPVNGSFDVAGHIDRLRSLFVACFGLWNPLPAVLERALYRIYTDRGWDLRSGDNPRLTAESDFRLAFPVMTDLDRAVDDVIYDLGYDKQIADNLRGALSVRINALRLGAKGRMLDTRVSHSPEALFDRPVVVELEGLGDEDDKAFLMGLLLIQLAGYRRLKGRSQSLRHVLVVEEAHRLLRNVGEKGGAEENNSAAKAVESFANLLAEVRAYGQGVVIADQVPTGLAPVVLKNTNLKIAHRLVAADDREAVGGTMVMTKRQIQHLATLPRGSAAVFAEGEDAPLLIKIPSVSGQQGDIPDSALQLSAAQLPSDCPGDSSLRGACCPYANRLLASLDFRTAVSRFAIACLNGGTLRWEATDLSDLLAAAITPGVTAGALQRCALGRAARWFADRRGAQYGWDYGKVETMTRALQQLFEMDLASGVSAEQLERFRNSASPLFKRQSAPFPMCYRICPDETCMFRGSVLDFLQVERHTEAWSSVDRSDMLGPELLEARWAVADRVGIEIVGLDAGAPVRQQRRSGTIRAGLCFVQHVTRLDQRLTPTEQRDVVSQIEDAYGLGAKDMGEVPE